MSFMGEKGIVAGDWLFSQQHGQACQVIEVQELWGDNTCRVWLPGLNIVTMVPEQKLIYLEEKALVRPELITYIASAARVREALNGESLVGPVEASVIPLPHQLKVLTRAVSGDRVRYLLADEVGLGKTVEAGLIMRELKLRGLVQRVLVVAPKGLVMQWIAEMKTHFSEDFRLIVPGDLAVYRRVAGESNLWQAFDQVVCSLDSVKPMDKRRGWSFQQVEEYNRERFEDLLTAGWDLIIIDEAHRLGGSTEQVARFKLGRGLAGAAPYLLLLSATPHQGKSDAFFRLLSLLDPDAFPGMDSISKERVQPYVIRNEKRLAIDDKGQPLFKARNTVLHPVSWGAGHHEQQVLYDAVSDYVRNGYNQAIKEKKTYLGFLMILMQRLVTSSTQAIRSALERRLEVLQAPEEQLTLFNLVTEDEWEDMDGQEQMDALINSRLKAMKNERAEVKLLLEIARRVEYAGPDIKAESLLDWIYRLQQEEGDPDLKLLVFTEFVPTQQMLKEFLDARGFSAVCLNGSMTMEEREAVQLSFAGEARILISTEAGGEGLNLQFCHVVINFDIPWNPMRLEQRIGRVDRIGQSHPVKVVNYFLENTVEFRVREVLEEKLVLIQKEFGVDKTSDVLDSGQGKAFDQVYIQAIANPDKLEESLDKLVSMVKESSRANYESNSLFGQSEILDPWQAKSILAHPLPFWVERMLTCYLESHDGKASKKAGTWQLLWPDGERELQVVFTLADMQANPTARHMTLEDNRVRQALEAIPRFVPGQPIAAIRLDNLSSDISGYWSLWEICLDSRGFKESRTLALFMHDDGRVLEPTARRIWEELIQNIPQVTGIQGGKHGEIAWEQLRDKMKAYGESVFLDLKLSHQQRIEREQHKGEYALQARRQATQRVGLENVRKHRQARLDQEEKEFRQRIQEMQYAVPDLLPLLILRVQGGDEVK